MYSGTSLLMSPMGLGKKRPDKQSDRVKGKCISVWRNVGLS